jgi:cell division septation protein DedD
MPKTEEGEFELILGNRQLLSVFFIVVVLLGVFFTMGYIVGRNSSPGAQTSAAQKAEPKPIVIEPGTQPSPAGESAAAPSEPAASPSAEATPPSDAQSESASAPPAPSRSRSPQADAAKPESASPTPEDPVPGATYLQVAAVARAEAELFVDVLAKKGFHAIYAPVPNQAQLFRVLVGPFKDAAVVAQARTDLNNAGFKGFEALQRKF